MNYPRLWIWAGALALACSGAQARPSGPPPEYEKPRVLPWDAAAPQDDPFAEAERGGEPVTSELDGSGDAGNDALPSTNERQ
jgi:hypothetical protein